MEGARLAVAADTEAMAAVATSVVADLEGARGAELFLARERAATGTADWFARVLDDASSIGVVGTYDGVVLGYGLAVVEELADGRRLAVLTDLAVEPEARAVGIGEVMMNLVLAQAEERACVGIDSWALPGDRATKNFFESFGLKARLLTVHRPLGP